MSIKKDEAIQGILTDFEGFGNLILQQLDLLEDIVNSGELAIPEETAIRILENEKHVNKIEVKLSEKSCKCHCPLSTDGIRGPQNCLPPTGL
jgi:small nuclear ribonucleoprotein (snRNP)-like protein